MSSAPWPSIVSAAELESLLGQILFPTTESIRTGEEAMRKALSQPAFVCDLFAQLEQSQSPQVRQLAAVLVRRRVAGHWTKLAQPVQQLLQATLLRRLPAEPERPVRRSLTSVVAVVARYALPRGEWPELFGFLVEAARSPTAEHRELSMILLSALLESSDVVESSLRPHFELLGSTLHTLVSDVANPAVSRAALKAIGAWSAVVLDHDDENTPSVNARVLKPLLTPMVELCRSAASVSDEDTVCVAFQIWYEMIEASSTVVNAELARILELALAAATSASMEPETRIAGLNLVGNPNPHPNRIAGLNLVDAARTHTKKN